MKRIAIYTFLLLLTGFGLMNCERDNFNEVIDTPEVLVPTEVEFEAGLELRSQGTSFLQTEGSARRLVGPTANAYVITSGTITCEGGSVYSTEYQGSDFFTFEFSESEGSFFAYNIILTAAVDGVSRRVLFALVPPGSGCQDQNNEVIITSLTDDHISGSFTGAFFSLDGPLSPDLPCFGFNYVGEYTAFFSLPYQDCE